MADFLAGARAEGLSVVINSAYRDYATQNYLYERKVSQYGGDRAVAATIVAPPGTSEHQTGLCADIADRFYETKDRSIANTATFKWMEAHCAEYGFILRYPEGKEDITGIMYEPWHFRYVGKEAAAFIMENGLCLEEFLALYGVE
jgi:LAS superfamily LD-carboxypeptidase LdcB